MLAVWVRSPQEQRHGLMRWARAQGCERSVITYSSLITACEKAGEWSLALKFFRDMPRDGCRPNVVTYNSLLSALSNGAPRCRVAGCACALFLLSICLPHLHWRSRSGDAG